MPLRGQSNCCSFLKWLCCGIFLFHQICRCTCSINCVGFYPRSWGHATFQLFVGDIQTQDASQTVKQFAKVAMLGVGKCIFASIVGCIHTRNSLDTLRWWLLHHHPIGLKVRGWIWNFCFEGCFQPIMVGNQYKYMTKYASSRSTEVWLRDSVGSVAFSAHL